MQSVSFYPVLVPGGWLDSPLAGRFYYRLVLLCGKCLFLYVLVEVDLEIRKAFIIIRLHMQQVNSDGAEDSRPGYALLWTSLARGRSWSADNPSYAADQTPRHQVTDHIPLPRAGRLSLWLRLWLWLCLSLSFTRRLGAGGQRKCVLAKSRRSTASYLKEAHRCLFVSA